MSIAFWTAPALLAVLAWGVSTFLAKLAVRDVSPVRLSIFLSGFFLLGAIAVQGFYGFSPGFDPRGVALAVLIGLVGGLAQIFYNISISASSLTYCVVVTALYPAVATLLAFIFLGETLTVRQGAGIVLGVAALILMAVSRDDG